MATQDCKLEFYFKRQDIEALLSKNPSAKGIIISHAIVQKKQPNGKNYNLVEITARVDKKTKAKTSKTAKAGLMGDSAGDGTVGGCPFPPGCTE